MPPWFESLSREVNTTPVTMGLTPAWLRRFDLYPKPLEDFSKRTLLGGTVSLATILVIFILVTLELRAQSGDFRSEEHLHVDMDRYSKTDINLDITLNGLACSLLHVDVVDVVGEARLDIEHELHMTLLSKDGSPVNDSRERLDVGINGKGGGVTGSTDSEVKLQKDYCGSCYGARQPGVCCQTCADVQDAYKDKNWRFVDWDTIEQCKREGFAEKHRLQHERGCRIDGVIKVNKVQGQFRIEPGKNVRFLFGGMAHDLKDFMSDKKVDLTHTINTLSFGKAYPEKIDPLNGVSKEFKNQQGSATYSYYIQVVPTVFNSADERIVTNQFSVTEHEHIIQGASVVDYKQSPGIFFTYDFSPFVVSIHRRAGSWTELFTAVCAIIGGTFTVAGLVDVIMFRSLKSQRVKQILGYNS